jgi:hypothetical protein
VLRDPGLISVVLFLRISEHRIDIMPKQTRFEERSRNGYANALRRLNYSEPGQRIYPWFIASVMATQIGGLIAVFFTS